MVRQESAKLSFTRSNRVGTSNEKGHPQGCPFSLEKQCRPDLKDEMQMFGGHLLEPGWTGSTPWLSSLWEENATNRVGTSKVIGIPEMWYADFSVLGAALLLQWSYNGWGGSPFSFWQRRNPAEYSAGFFCAADRETPYENEKCIISCITMTIFRAQREIKFGRIG